jgi:hypothetical protein
MGRKPIDKTTDYYRKQPKKGPTEKTTVYYPESDLLIFDKKNRKKALKIAKEISLKAVEKAAKEIGQYRAEMAQIGRGVDIETFIKTLKV